jgi:hypothetical protein
MPEASSSPTAEIHQDVWSLSPAEAGEILQQASLEYSQRQVPISATTAHDAELLLAARRNDPEVARKALAGDIKTLDELRDLAERAMGNITDAGADQPIVDTTVGDQSVNRAGLISWAEDARARGFPNQAIEHFLAGGKFTPEAVATAQYFLPRMERDETLLYADWPQDREYQLEAFRWIVSAGTMDTP